MAASARAQLVGVDPGHTTTARRSEAWPVGARRLGRPPGDAGRGDPARAFDAPATQIGPAGVARAGLVIEPEALRLALPTSRRDSDGQLLHRETSEEVWVPAWSSDTAIIGVLVISRALH
jgi:hypothetical protein